MRLLVLDQAKTTGYAVFNGGELIESGIIKSKCADYIDVIDNLTAELKELNKKHNPSVVLLEDVQAQSNALTHKHLSMMLGTLRHECISCDISVNIIHSSTWRTLLRKEYQIKGRPKRAEWKKYSKQYVVDKYSKTVTDDEADAVCIGAYYNKLMGVC